MSYIFCPVPGASNQDENSADQIFRTLTGGIFACYPPYSIPTDPNGELNLQIERRGQEPGAICAKSGNWFPGEHLTTDGQGRTVGKPFYTDGPAVPYMPPFPPFGKSPS